MTDCMYATAAAKDKHVGAKCFLRKERLLVFSQSLIVTDGCASVIFVDLGVKVREPLQ